MNILKKVLAVGCLLALLVPVLGCSEEGAMEKAGRDMDRIVKDAEDSFNDVVSNTKRKLGIHEPGPAEKLLGESGRSVDDALQDAEKAYDDALDGAKDFIDGLKN